MSTPSELRNEALQELWAEAEAEAHYESHVGNTCEHGCDICSDDHQEHAIAGTYAPYDDCQYCEAGWYAAQQGE